MGWIQTGTSYITTYKHGNGKTIGPVIRFEGARIASIDYTLQPTPQSARAETLTREEQAIKAQILFQELAREQLTGPRQRNLLSRL